MGEPTPDVTVDGVFTAWPRNANLLLLRTSGIYPGYPAMLEYAYGAGRVLATSSYGDWAVYNQIWWGDDWPFSRSILSRGYLLAQGKDVGDVQQAAPDTDVTVAFSVTNNAAFAVSPTQIMLPRNWTREGQQVGSTAIVSSAIAPGASSGLSVTLRAPPVYRGVHNWTQVGLYHVASRHTTDIGAYTLHGPFVHVPSPISPARVSLTFAAEEVAARPYSLVRITATVRNHTAFSQTVVLRGVRDLPTAPITISLAPGAAALQPYTLVMDRSKHVQANLTTLTTTVLFQGSLVVHLGWPNLVPRVELPPAIRAGALITVHIGNQPNYWAPAGTSLTSTLSLDFGDPTGAVRWSGQRSIPPLRQGETSQLVFVAGDSGPAQIGYYSLDYELHSEGSQLVDERLAIPAYPTLIGAFDRTHYGARGTVHFTATALNLERLDLSPAITITF
ncbi:MAG: hypothetical protein OIN84_12955, partial [Candidatus Methanoperedens sp.]|nr:hypothetical protein [Candidatus Methanoperedens sp.]